jgi:hypothetical protein
MRVSKTLLALAASTALRGAALALLTASCAAGTEAPDAVGYVLLDRDAAQAGRLAHGGWDGAPVLPVALDLSQPVTFSSDRGRTTIELRSGMLAWVHGAGAAVEWRTLHDEVRDDRLRVRASADAAAALARSLAGEVVGPVDGDASLWTVAAPNVFDRASFLQPPEGVLEALPEPLLDLAAPVFLPGAVVGRAAFVGLYTAGDRVLILDAAGGFTLGRACDDDAAPVTAGRWHVDDASVVLVSNRESLSLDYDPKDGTLREVGGERFSSALVDSVIAAMPKEEP